MKIINIDIIDKIAIKNIEDTDSKSIKFLDSILSIPADNYNNILLNFDFISPDATKDGLHLFAVFSANFLDKPIEVEITELDVDGKYYKTACFIPFETLAKTGCVELGVYGYELNNDDSLNKRISLTPIIYSVNTGSYREDAVEGIIPTPTVFEVYFDKVANMANVYAEKKQVSRQLNDLNKTLQDNINSETIARENGDNFLQHKIDTESNIRGEVDSNLQSQINSLASGSPLVASDISEMTDTSRVYVNATDGNWYYYNGTNWVIGGVYQATELENDKYYTLIMGDNVLSTLENVSYNLVDKSKLSSGYISKNTGEIVKGGNEWYYTDLIPVKPNHKYIVVANNNHVILDKNKNIIKLLNSNLIDETYKEIGYQLGGLKGFRRLLTIPDNGYYLRATVSQNIETESNIFEYTEENKNYFPLFVKENPISKEIYLNPFKDKYLIDIIEIMEKENIVSANKIKYILNGIAVDYVDADKTKIMYKPSSRYFATNFFKVKENEKYIVSDMLTVIYKDANDNITSAKRNDYTDYPIKRMNDKYILTVPSEVDSILLHTDSEIDIFPYAYRILDETLINALSIPEDNNDTVYDMKLPDHIINILSRNLNINNKLQGKKWNVLGDSITSTDYSTPNWWEMISSRTGIIVTDYGFSGTSLAHTDDRHLWAQHFEKDNAEEIGYVKDNPNTWATGNCFCERYARMIDDADIITVMGGTNDSNVPLGEWNSSDTSTFYGALNVLMSGLLEKYKGKTIAFFTPIQSKNIYKYNVSNPSKTLDDTSPTSTLSLQLRAEAIKRKCVQYGIPCLDLFSTSGINGVDSSYIYYRSDDTFHPSNEGQERLATVIQNFIESIL